MLVTFKVGDILDEDVDLMVCPGSTELNMCGGVGGEILLRGGQSVQDELMRFLRNAGKHQVAPGTILELAPGPVRARYLIYAVAMNDWHESSEDLVRTTIAKILLRAEQLQARVIGMPAMGTGSGGLSHEAFGRALRAAINNTNVDLDECRLVLHHENVRARIQEQFATLAPAF